MIRFVAPVMMFILFLQFIQGFYLKLQSMFEEDFCKMCLTICERLIL